MNSGIRRPAVLSGDNIFGLGERGGAIPRNLSPIRYAAFTDVEPMAKILLFAPVAILGFLAVVLGPNAYNYNWHPLAIFHQQIILGQDCARAEASIAAYLSRRPEAQGGRAKKPTLMRLVPLNEAETVSVLYIYDVGPFDSPYLEIFCDDSTGRISGTSYVAD